MATFSMPSGGTGSPQRPTQADKGANPIPAMKGTGKAAQSAPVATLQDGFKSLAQAGQVVDKLPAKVVPTTATPAGNNTNLQTVPSDYPRNAPSRHPNVGSAPGPRTKNLAKLKGR